MMQKPQKNSIEQKLLLLEDKVELIKLKMVTKEDMARLEDRMTGLENRMGGLENRMATKDDLKELAGYIENLFERYIQSHQKKHDEIDANFRRLGVA